MTTNRAQNINTTTTENGQCPQVRPTADGFDSCRWQLDHTSACDFERAS